MTATTIDLVRHGQSAWNAAGRWQGQADSELSELGVAQARAAGSTAAAREGHVDAVVSSDLRRARDTAEILAAALGLTVATDPRLRERCAGAWEGLTREEIEREFPGWLAEGRRPPGWEPDDELVHRARAALAEHAAAWRGGAVVAVAHGGIIRALERSLGCDGAPLPNLAGRRFTVAAGHLTAGGPVRLVDPDTVLTVPPHP